MAQARLRAGGDDLYSHHIMEHGHRHASPEEYQARRAVFHANRRHVEATNAQQSSSYSVELNHFADWSEVRPADL